MLYKIVNTETEKIFQIPGFPGSQRRIPKDAIALCEKSCIISKCPHHQRNPGGCAREKELQKTLRNEINNKKDYRKL